MKLGLLSLGVLFLLSVRGFAATSGDVRLVEAIENKDIDAARALLRQHVDVNVPALDGSTAVAWAAHWDDLNTASLLIAAGANVNTPNDMGATPLWLACFNGSAAMVEKLLEAGADPNAAHLPGGETVLLRCAGTGNVQAVKALLAHGARMDAKENAGQTALMWALAERHPEVARVLIEQWADVNAVSRGGFTPLMFAAQQGDVESGRLLLEKGANLKATSRIPEGGASGGSTVDWLGRSQESTDAFFVAILSGREQFAIFLVENGVNPNAVDSRGMTGLHYALLQGISDLNGAQHEPHFGAIDLVSRPNMIELVDVLLKHGADPNVRILRRVPPLTAQQRPKIRLIGATPFLLAAATGDVRIMKMLLAKGADPLLTTKDGTTPLMAAAGISRREDRTKDEERDALEALKLTIELGGNVNAANKNGFTAMHGAAFTGANEIMQFLADKGARLDVKDKFGESPLSIAAGDPNGLAEQITRNAHESTEALLRKLMGDYNSLAVAPQEADNSRTKADQ